MDSCLAGADEFFDDVTGNVGEAEIAALVAISQPLVIESEQVEHYGVQIADMHWVCDGIPAQFVGRANYSPAGNASTGHPDGEGVGMMIAVADGATY